MTVGPTEPASGLSDEDKARTRYLNDELRVHGRGGVVTVSLALHGTGTGVIENVLRGLASYEPDAGKDAMSGSIDIDGMLVRWGLAAIEGPEGPTRIMSVWLAAEAW